jgi:3-hydroxyacyl-[acyl-carrier-protein] dehydratase
MNKFLDIKEIMKVIPHRYPFLLIDRIVKSVPDIEIIALKNITANEEFFKGHFPLNPVMPGVLIIEAMAQAAAFFAMQHITEDHKKDAICYLATLDKVRFRHPVIPGDTMYLHIKQIQKKSKICKMAGEARVDDNVVAEAVLTAILK